jgi:ATP-dependent DNA helicase RecG
LSLADGVRALRGVGPGRAVLLERLGVVTIGDLLRLLPRRYEDRRNLTTIAALETGASGSFVARVVSAGARITPQRRRRVFRAILEDDTGTVEALWFRFHAPYLQALARPGARLLVHGTITAAGGIRRMIHPELEPLGEGGERAGPAIRPVYPATEGISQATLRAIVRRALEDVLPHLEDQLPVGLCERLGLPGLAESLAAVHLPGDQVSLETLAAVASPWQRRLRFDELFALQLQLVSRRRRYEAARPRHDRRPRQDLLEHLRTRLPFALTAAQERVCREILADMAGPRPMQRLLQGDVGSGKTVVAALAVLAAVAGGGQAALLVPTELLAEQHHLTLGRLADLLGVEAALLTGSVPRQRRAEVLAGLGSGRTRFVVGTHALLEERVEFSRLALAVVDEQHRFGVRQRLRLREKGEAPDLLVMTATPIPRSLALALYGDLDLSVIDELPPGRQPVTTRVVGETARREAWELVRGELRKGNRVYVVCPLAEEGAEEEGLDAARAAQRLRAHFRGIEVGLVHGRMRLEERSRAMQRFRSGETPLLVSTTVVEVGLDVPEATVMLVERAERFGLSQLHQLRGRVGRGPDPAHCLLFTGPRPSPEALERLSVLERTADGFAVAQADLELRGPGLLAGTLQSGLAGLRLGELAGDPALLAAAREAARGIIAADPDVSLPQHAGLRALVESAAGTEGPPAGTG